MRALALLLLAGCAGGNINSEPVPQAQWTAGPDQCGRDYRENCSAGTVISGNVIAFPTGTEAHYITRAGSLKGKSAMHLSFHSDGPLRGAGCSSTSMVSLYFASADNDWRSDGLRWWSGATFVDHAGDYTIDASLDGPWSSVMIQTSAANTVDFAAAKDRANRVGFTFGNCTGLGHGAAGPGRITVTAFEVVP